jgi:hypothetical protein
LVSGQRVYFTQPITYTPVGGSATNLFSATTKLVTRSYWVKALNNNTFVLANSLANYTAGSFIAFPSGTIATYPTIVYSQVLGRGLNTVSSVELLTLPMVRARKYAFNTSAVFNSALDASVIPGAVAPNTDPGSVIFLNNSAVVLGEDQITPYGEDLTASTQCGWLPSLNLVAPTLTPASSIDNAYCVPTVDQFFQPEAFFVPSIGAILGGTYTANVPGTIGPVATLTVATGGAGVNGTYNNVAVGGGSGTGLTATITVAGGLVTAAVVNNAGQGYGAADTGLTLPAAFGGATLAVATLNSATTGSITAVSAGYATQTGLLVNSTGTQLNTSIQSRLVGIYFDVVGSGNAPDGTTAVVAGDRIALVYNGTTYTWVVIPAASSGGDLTVANQPCYSSQVELVFTPEQSVPATLWRFDAITSTEIIDNALRGVGFGGVPQAVFIDSGIDNVNRLFEDSQRYFNPFGFIAYYGPWIENGSGQYIPPSPYVTGVAVRRYRAEGYQFPPAGVKYQLADAVSAQIPINSAQQNLLNPDGCNAIRTLPGYPQSAVFIWGGRTRVNTADAQQKLYQFVNTRVILNIVYGSLRNAFDSQIFNVIDGFGIIYNQIISVGNSVLNQLYTQGALFGARPSNAFQVICDARINPPESLENGIVNAKVFVTPVPTLERIQIDLIRVAIGKMQEELDIRGLGQSNA